ncbi:hypothetical protein ABFT23_05880 [Nocardioides sp. C4-1]|uniref:hypothetical protein n=1 Tax=Nocardioides sp. C4-1 TaxID=3151851 RepID=UPI0032644324
MRIVPSIYDLSRSLLTPAVSIAGAGALVVLTAAPGMAAEPVAQSDATALSLTLLSQPLDSGTVTAVHDGKRERVTGTQDPLVTVLGNQPFLNAGTLSQAAKTNVVDRRGLSAACAGLAGDGATLVSVDEGFCLRPGNNATINAGTLDLSGVEIVRTDLLAGLDQALLDALDPLLTPVLAAVQGVVQDALVALGDPGIVLDLGAVQSQCTATPAVADGTSQITDASLALQLPAPIGRVDLVELPTNPPANTKVVTDLDVVLTTLTAGVQTQLDTALNGALAGVGQLLGQLVTALNANVVSALADQLAPLEDNVLDATLNKQTRGDGSIEVTALDLRVLPAAAQFGVEPLSVAIGRSACGANARVDVPSPSPSPEPSPSPVDPGDPGSPAPSPAVPTSVPAGELEAAAAPTGDGAVNAHVAAGAIAVLTLLAAAGGVHAFRRVLRS